MFRTTGSDLWYYFLWRHYHTARFDMRALCGFLLLALCPHFSYAGLIHVPADQPTIEAGLAAAAAGDTVLIACGTYFESQLTLPPYTTIRSEGGTPDCVTIDAQSASWIMDAHNAGDILVEGITFKNGHGSSGGGLGVYATHLEASDVVFEGCSAESKGGAVYADEGATSEFQRCTFHSCTSGWVGGAFACYSGSHAFTECVFYNNSAGANGAAIFCPWLPLASVQGCTLVGNSTPGVGSVIHYMGQMVNTIVAFNEADGAVHGASAVHCSDVFGNAGGDWIGDMQPWLGIEGNVAVDPEFCDINGADYRLNATSPCLPGQHPSGAECGLIGALGSCWDDSPVIAGITDVPNDQGRRVRITWASSIYDAPEYAIEITGYSIWRRIDDLRDADMDHDSIGRKFGDRVYPPGDWDYVTTVPARGEDQYSTVVQTLCDSTTAGICLSTFFVSAMTPDPLVYFDSEPESGYSVDNLAPGAPLGLTMPVANVLRWEEVVAEDLWGYDVYFSQDESFADYELLGSTSDTQFDVSGSEGGYLAVRARDFAGNESELSVYFHNLTTVEASPAPSAPILEQNVPNPFNPTTVIRFGLPEASTVSLAIFDVSGRCVRSLLAGKRVEAGWRSISWDGRGMDDRPVSSGIYLYRLDAGPYSAARTMALVK